ncbi:glycosyltransferase [Chryseobacterium sp. MYb264]|uniref:glycosyltransferase family 2 protein n=1 Tax=Chryseobacterium sp. MYb264 TaxID=2745153 RepID=UPI002E11F994|nr:glycosyltransferase [Chryseobacterium sp. MYb264]
MLETMFSVVICSFNKSGSLTAVLTNMNRLVKENTECPFEVIVVVDGSTDNTLEAIGKLTVKYPIRVFYIENSGLSNARNFGLDQSLGRYIVFCDDDVVFHPDYFIHLQMSIQRYPDHVHIGNLINIDKEYSAGIVRSLLNNEDVNYNTLGEKKKDHVFFEAAKQLFFYRNENDDFTTAIWWAVVTGGNLCIPKYYFETCGVFDHHIKGWGPEDADLCYRFFLKGVKATYNDSCLLYHLDHPRDLKAIYDTMTTNAVYFIKKYEKPKELYAYLNFTNGKISLNDFNELCCDIFGMEKVNIPAFSMSMKDYSGREQFLKHQP